MIFPIRVLHVLHSMNRGGAETMIMNLYRNIDRKKVQFDFLLTCQEKCQYEDEILSLGGRVFRVPVLKLYNPFPYINGVKTFLKNHREYKIVHSHTSGKSTVPLWIAKKCGVKVRIAHLHSSYFGEHALEYLLKVFAHFLKFVATDFFACGDLAAKYWLGEELAKSDRTRFLPNAIDLDKYSRDSVTRNWIRRELCISDDTFVLGHVARFCLVKNHLFTIDVFNSLLQLCPNACLLLVGDGELRNDIIQRIKKYRIEDRVIMTGIVGNVPDYLQAMDAVVMPSLNEGLPVSLVEAQASGLPCYASTGIPKEVNITGNVMFIPIAEGAERWADKITRPHSVDVNNVQTKLKGAGYDIHASALWLQNWYLNSITQ